LDQLTRAPLDEGSPAWSPDGARLAYVAFPAAEEDSAVDGP
jgi:hypothetical protein